MRLLFCAVIAVIAGFYSCNYTKEVKKETVKRFNSHKNFMVELGFAGIVENKEFCKDCKINKYTLKIRLIQLNKQPEFSERYYPPYYYFENDSILNISVGVNLFNNIAIKDTVKKEAKSFIFKILDKEIQYLNSEELRWFPE